MFLHYNILVLVLKDARSEDQNWPKCMQINHRQLVRYEKTDQNYIDMPKIIIF
jgi:hypothetical protein